MAKMSQPWIALCTAAIGAIYTAGYITTENHASALAAPVSAPTIQHVEVAKAKPTSYHQPKVNKPKSIYKDGTFTGSGSNRRGTMAVAVTIKNDKIADVTISDFEMHYDESDINSLPSEVVKRQSAEVDNVSGDTYSTEAFQEAVQDAISQARNA